jgi:hypothetical protein
MQVAERHDADAEACSRLNAVGRWELCIGASADCVLAEPQQPPSRAVAASATWRACIISEDLRNPKRKELSPSYHAIIRD